MHALYLYFIGLSFKNTSKHWNHWKKKEEVTHVAIWNWVQQFNPKNVTLEKEGRISAFIIDETMVQIGGRNEAWMWIAIEPVHSTVLRIVLSRHRHILLLNHFLDLWLKFMINIQQYILIVVGRVILKHVLPLVLSIYCTHVQRKA